MRSSALLAVMAASLIGAASPAPAQTSDPTVDCARGISQACWEVRFGNCAHENPRVAIPACTRRLISEASFFHRDQIIGGSKRLDQAQFYGLRGNAYARQGNVDRALADYDRALKASRGIFWVHANRGTLLFERGDYQAALSSFDEAIGLAPENSILLNARARLRAAAPDASVRDGAAAVADASRAVGLHEIVPVFYFDTLAAAYAESGDFARAAETQEGIIGRLPAEERAAYQGRLDLYRRNMPFRIVPDA